ncbi:opacity protein-like surface antigen [Flavobacterium cutihirudinis]|uniref:Opacity protein-like surface antigen n=1 Tax=Flavobacterium cutihirudinis TaxID=1265740 RepID=A0A3D9FLE9_9FLAO|nr:porin family protein [Flavobacterium cutihirudinis]RED18976.1 opacity protein-like surface antigen [Flavobacterium cutihirudinis]
MKKIILSAIAIMVFTFSNAQETRFGVKGGLNLTNFAGGWDTTIKAGFHIGGFAEIKVIERMAIQPELLFSTQGARYSMDGGNNGGYYKLNYISVPVLAKFYVTKQFTVEGGPQIGFLVSAKNEGRDIKDEYESTDLGFNFGAGYNFTDNLAIGLRYTLGLSDVLNKDYYNDYDNVRNSVLALNLSYKF